MSTTQLKPCTCTNSYQDEHYGHQVRVFNSAPKSGPNKTSAYRCTVCGRIAQ